MNKIMKEEQKHVRVIEGLLPKTYEESTAALRWLSKQPIQVQLYAKEKTAKVYQKLKTAHKEIDLANISLASDLIVAIKIKTEYSKRKRKNPSFQAGDLTLLSLMQAKEFQYKKRVSPKRRYLQMHKGQLYSWRALGASYEQIASKLLTPEGKTISAEYIRRFMHEQKEV